MSSWEGKVQVANASLDSGFEIVNDAHDILSGKALHGQDIFENEGRLMNLFKDPEFKARKEHYTNVIAPTPSPSKAK